MKENRFIEILKLATSIVICQLAGFIGSLFTIPNIPTWYQGLRKPIFTPPNWIFGPVWITLFGLMGISAFVVWRLGLKEQRVKIALIFFSIQLALNTLWSVAFFGLRSPLTGLVEIVLLWIAVFATVKRFFKVATISGILLLPYLFWISFAAILNFFLWTLNL
jgi:translocator protein